MKRKHIAMKGLGGGRCRRDSMFHVSSSIYRGHTPCGERVAELAEEQDYPFLWPDLSYLIGGRRPCRRSHVVVGDRMKLKILLVLYACCILNKKLTLFSLKAL